MSRYPIVSIAVPVYNEEKRIKNVLENIFGQDYPKSKLDVIVVDDGSNDRTVEYAKNFPVRVVISGKKNAEVSMLVAFKKARGEFFTFIAGDMEFRTKTWLKKMTKPLIENPDIPQAATRYYQHPNESLISRYLSLDPVQLDPVFRYFAPSIEKTIVEKKVGYYITRYSQEKIPPQNAGVYRISIMKKIYKGEEKWMDLDQFPRLVEKGYTKFAYVPNAGFYHFHADSLGHLIKKRTRNLKQIYLKQITERRYTWFKLENVSDWLKIVWWVILANLFVPLFVVSLYKSLRDKTWLWLLDAPVALILTDVILVNMLLDPKGVKLIMEGVKKSARFIWLQK